MAVEYRKLTKKDLDTFIQMRINQLREEGAKEDMDLKPALKDYYDRYILAVPVERWDYFQVCLLLRNIADGE